MYIFILSNVLQDHRHQDPSNGAGLSPDTMPRCEEPIDNFYVSCMTDEIGGGTVQDPTWDVMNETELYVRTNENNVTMFVNVSSGMPISFNITKNGTIEQQLSRELGSSKHIIRRHK